MDIQIEYMALADLLNRFHPRNPKQHDIGAIVTSIQKFGYVDPGVLDEKTGLFVEGHGRTQALAEMQRQQMNTPERIEQRNGDWYIPVIRGVRFEDDHMVDAYLIAANRTTELGGWDESQLAALLQDIAAQDEGLLAATGYDGDDLDALLQELNPLPPEGFPEYGEDIETEYRCPQCGYEWSGKSH